MKQRLRIILCTIMCGILCFATTSCEDYFTSRQKDEIYSASWKSEVWNIILESGNSGSKVILDIGDYCMTEEDYENLEKDTTKNYKYLRWSMRSLIMEIYYQESSYNIQDSNWVPIKDISLIGGDVKYYGDYFILTIGNTDLLFNFQYKTIRFDKITD